MVDSLTGRPVVLVVDDDPANLRVFQRVFRKQYEILAATSGAEAFELLRTRTADVAFIDYQMPDMDGGEVLAELKRSHPDIVRYLLTGNCDNEHINGLCERGLCEAVLSKPWDREHIVAAMSRGLARRLTGS